MGGATVADNDLPACTVVVCTRNRSRQLDECLAALSRLEWPPAEVIVVDSASEGNLNRPVAERWRAQYIYEPVAGLSRARNVGARAASGEVVAYIDDDATPASDWLRAIAREFRDPKVGGVTGPVLPARAGQLERREVDSTSLRWFEQANFGELGDGANMAFRREAFRDWRGFDESLGRGAALPYAEDHYALFEVIKRGYRVVYTPSAVVCHPEPASREAQIARQFEDRMLSVAYVVKLAVELPAYRGALFRYIFARRARASEHKPQPRLSWFKRWDAAIRGAGVYLRARRNRRQHAPAP